MVRFSESRWLCSKWESMCLVAGEECSKAKGPCVFFNEQTVMWKRFTTCASALLFTWKCFSALFVTSQGKTSTFIWLKTFAKTIQQTSAVFRFQRLENLMQHHYLLLLSKYSTARFIRKYLQIYTGFDSKHFPNQALILLGLFTSGSLNTNESLTMWFQVINWNSKSYSYTYALTNDAVTEMFNLPDEHCYWKHSVLK